MVLRTRLEGFDRDNPPAWGRAGVDARPNLHGMLRYPAMMVPSMQGDILDAILAEVGRPCRVLDPFVGSGTVMTEALLRGQDFTGVDINPLAILVCEAKAAVDRGADVGRAARTVVRAIRRDAAETVDVAFPGLSKWFDLPSALRLSRIRRAILQVSDAGARKVMWTVFAETIRSGSNSRTSTYKLHVRPEGDRVDAGRLAAIFEDSLRETLSRVRRYREEVQARGRGATPDVTLIRDDVRRSGVGDGGDRHRILVTSPPYGDNLTTITYGQFSYLAMCWIPAEDLHGVAAAVSNTHALDTASLGGSLRNGKADRVRGMFGSLDAMTREAGPDAGGRGLPKVENFVSDLFDAFTRVRATSPGSAHWVVTVGNRTARGRTVPLDDICREMLCSLGGTHVASVRRRLPVKRMPTRNGIGPLINTETTLVAEFA